MTPTHAVLNVPAISCNHCKMAIEVAVDVAEKSVAVDYNEAGVTLEAIEAAVQEEGYEVTGRSLFGD